MATTRKEEQRLLSGEELEIVSRTRHPDIRQVEDGELPKLKSRLRERRDEARRIAARQRSEVRGKARAARSEEERDDAGIQRKLALLSRAMRRLNREAERRQRSRGLGRMMDDMWDTLSGEDDEPAPKRRRAPARKHDAA